MTVEEPSVGHSGISGPAGGADTPGAGGTLEDKARFVFELAKLENDQVIETFERMRRHSATGLTFMGVAATLLADGKLTERTYDGWALASLLLAMIAAVGTVWSLVSVLRPAKVSVVYPIDALHAMLVDDRTGRRSYRSAQYYEGVVGAVANARTFNDLAHENAARRLRFGIYGIVVFLALFLIAAVLGDAPPDTQTG